MRHATVVWLRRDLRLSDNPALAAAAERGGPVIPLFVLPRGEAPGDAAPGGAAGAWLRRSLVCLSEDLARRGSRLVVRAGDPVRAILSVARATGARAAAWGRLREPQARAAEDRVREALRREGVRVDAFDASLLFAPDDVRTSQGGPYRVFTPYYRRCMGLPEPSLPVPAPARISAPAAWPPSLRPEELLSREGRGGSGATFAGWTPGEAGAGERLAAFLDGPLASYLDARDRPGTEGTSRLSPHLHFGEIGPRQVWHAVRSRVEAFGDGAAARGAESFLRQLVWREFAHHLLHHFPGTASGPLREEFGAFPWRDDPEGLGAWRDGMTGYPIVDAGMRQLREEGWMHNRVRMVAASFLVKDLLVPWQAGAAWFLDALFDADLANNSLGWQWVAGCGADAAPFFRIFNPAAQGDRFDPDGTYVRRYVPEIAALPSRWIHRPWAAPKEALRRAGVGIGTTYPRPLVDHAAARARALEAVSRILRKGTDRGGRSG